MQHIVGICFDHHGEVESLRINEEQPFPHPPIPRWYERNDVIEQLREGRVLSYQGKQINLVSTREGEFLRFDQYAIASDNLH